VLVPGSGAALLTGSGAALSLIWNGTLFTTPKISDAKR
jgi:hypothetical protein